MKVFILFIMYFIFHIYMSNNLENIASKYYDTREKKNKTTPKVYDITHKFLPNLYKYEIFGNILTTIFMLPLLFNFNMLKELLGYWIIILAIRTITTMVTILPKYKECKYNNQDIMGVFGGCHDKIFSGHFASVFLSTLLYLKYGWIKMPMLILINLINSISILLVRGHYTIDLIVAFFVTLFVYQNDLRV